MAHPQQIVHVRENSEEAMQQLFDVLSSDKDSSGLSRDMRTRNLPASFFIPPQRQHALHSRENSQDSTHFPSHPLQPNHARSQSSPAQFYGSQKLSVPPTHHKQQKSVDLIDDQGWDPARHMHNFGQHFRFVS